MRLTLLVLLALLPAATVGCGGDEGATATTTTTTPKLTGTVKVLAPPALEPALGRVEDLFAEQQPNITVVHEFGDTDARSLQVLAREGDVVISDSAPAAQQLLSRGLIGPPIPFRSGETAYTASRIATTLNGPQTKLYMDFLTSEAAQPALR